MFDGAPRHNANAIGHGLWSKSPALRVTVPAAVGLIEMAEYASTLADAADWIARGLADHVPVDGEDARLIGLYASVAAEMAQMVGELLGETGIKAANLGRLDDAQFAAMMHKEAAALGLLLSQCYSAWQHVRDQEELAGNKGLMVLSKNGWRANPVLNYLAGSIRSAKRIMRDMAANRAWQQRGIEGQDDLAARLMGGDQS